MRSQAARLVSMTFVLPNYFSMRSSNVSIVRNCDVQSPLLLSGVAKRELRLE